MDHFGIDAGIRAAVEIYFRAGRQTGRTTSLIWSLKDGDRVVCLTTLEAKLLERRCKERGVTISTLVFQPKDWAHKLRDQGTPEGRLLFEHSWVEQMYRDAIDQCTASIDYMQRQFGGFGEAHLETRRRAEEITRWRL